MDRTNPTMGIECIIVRVNSRMCGWVRLTRGKLFPCRAGKPPGNRANCPAGSLRRAGAMHPGGYPHVDGSRRAPYCRSNVETNHANPERKTNNEIHLSARTLGS